MSEFLKKDVLSNNLKLHTETFGSSDNTACVLVAPKMATGRFWTDHFCNNLAQKGYFVIRYDHRDVGESSQIDWNNNPYTMHELAKDAITILDDYGIEKAHFIGNSMGGWVCQRIGIDFPNRVLSLVIISAGPIEIIEPSLMSITDEEQKILDKTNQLFQQINPGETALETAKNFLPIWQHLNGKFPLDEKTAMNFTLDMLTRTTNKNAGKNHDLMMDAFLKSMQKSNHLQKIQCPTLIIFGNADPVVLPRHEKAVADAIPNAKHIMIEGMGHTFFNQALEKKIAKLVVEHLKDAS